MLFASAPARGRALAVAAFVFGALPSLAAPGRHRKPVAASAPRVAMIIENRGTITIDLLPAEAPKTVAHFTDLVKKKFYDGILFHRVVPEFVVQAGDPKSKEVNGAKLRDITPDEVATTYRLGDGGSGTTVPLEAQHPHDRGTLGLARSSDPNSGDSQFFFNLVPNHKLDTGYCVFGKIADKKGLDVMDSIKQGDRIKSVRMIGDETGKAEPKPKKPAKPKK